MRAAARLPSVVLLLLAFPAATSAAPEFLGRNPGAQITLRAGEVAPSLITGLDVPLPDGDRAGAVRAMLIRDAEFFGFDPALSSLVALRPQAAGPFAVYRFAQRHLGLPVLGADIAVTVDGQGHVRIVGDALVRLGELPATFLVSAEQATTAAIRAVQPKRWSGEPKLVRQAIAGVAGEWRPVWEVQLSTAEPLGSFHVWVDAFSGEVLQSTNHFFRLNQGYAYPNCPEAGNYTTVDLANLPSTTGLVGSYVDMYSNCTPGQDCSAADRKAKPDLGGDYLIAPNEGSLSDGFAEVHTFFHINQMHDWFAATGFTGLDFAMPVAVNYAPVPDYYGMSCNAGYGDSAIMVGLCNLSDYGLGTGFVNFAYDSLSVMHEYTHGAVDHGARVDNYTTDTWGLVGQQMGLHEGFADFFPAVVLDDPKIGRHVGPKTGTGEYFRTLTDFRSCPNDIVGEPHDDGQIWGSANWEAYVAAAKDAQVPLAVFEGLLALSTRPTFQDAANAVLAAASTAHPTVYDALLAAYTAHGLLGCGREVELASGQKMTGSLYNPQSFGLSGSTSPFEMQYRVTVPLNATSLELTVKATNDQGQATSSVKYYVNYGSHVVFRNTGMTATSVKSGSFTIANPAPGAYYILPVGTNYGWNTQLYDFELTATVVGGESYDGGFPWYPDAGVPGLDAARPPGRDAAAPGPDAAAPGLDAAAPGPDAAASGPDAGTVVLGPDAEVVRLPDGSTVATGDAAQPADLDASSTSAPDAAGGGAGSKGCGCGVGGSSDPVASGLMLMAGLAFATSLRRRRDAR
ncbi:MAG TPA: hypothetical protein VGK67_27880 [Myxococcales bacterium]|jgi:MYXO-CTERM domain-containing protein